MNNKDKNETAIDREELERIERRTATVTFVCFCVLTIMGLLLLWWETIKPVIAP